MARIEDLADRFGRYIATPWQRTVSGAQRVIMVVYDKELERTLRARKLAFETAARQAGRDWLELDISNSFAAWMAADDYREEYFASPEDLQLKLQAEFPEYVAELLRAGLSSAGVTENSVVALFGVGSLFGFARLSCVRVRLGQSSLFQRTFRRDRRRPRYHAIALPRYLNLNRRRSQLCSSTRAGAHAAACPAHRLARA